MTTTSRVARSRPRHALLAGALLLTVLCSATAARAQGVRLFRDGDGGAYWDLSYGAMTGSSVVQVVSGSKAPVDYTQHWRGTSSIRLKYLAQTGGDWLLGVANTGWTPVDGTQLDSLVFWAYSATALPAGDLPLVFLEDKNNTRTPRYAMSAYNPAGLPAGVWTRLVMPLAPFKSGPGSADMTVVNKSFFAQTPTGAVNVLRTVCLDEIRWVKANAGTPATPVVGEARAFERHADLGWDLPTPASIESYRIERAQNGGWTPLTWAHAEDGGTAVWLGAPAVTCTLRVVAEDWSFHESAPTAAFALTTQALGDADFMDMIERATFRSFWQGAHPVSGLTRERSSSGDVCASGGTGFGLMAIPVGIERGYVTRTQGVARVLQVLTFLSTTAERHWGAFPHWIDGVSGQHVGFLGPTDDTVDLVETAYMAQGLLTVRRYFDGASADEASIRTLATQLWEAIEWDAFRPSGSDVLRWHRSPTTGYSNDQILGWNECMITYLLAVASPTHPVPPVVYHNGWARGGAMTLGVSYYGYPLYVGYAYGGPMFFAHYSFVGFDPRFKRDAYANYYDQNRDQALIQVAYAAANPGGWTGYGATSWGLTASDDPYGYSAHAPYSGDNGTLTPTAALASMPYVPQQSLAAARTFYGTYGATLWDYDGFRDAFHPGLGWTASDHIAIDQGPILLMIENHRTGLLWDRFMANPEIAPMLAALGFVADSGRAVDAPPAAAPLALRLAAAPNPAEGAMAFALDLPAAGEARVEVFDPAGRRVAVPQAGRLEAGRHRLAWDGRGADGLAVAPGVYLARVRAGAATTSVRFVRVR